MQGTADGRPSSATLPAPMPLALYLTLYFPQDAVDQHLLRDVDLFLVLSGDFASNTVEGRACLLFDRSRAAMVWGICLYWMTTRTDRAPFLAAWQLRRDGGHRGIVEGQW